LLVTATDVIFLSPGASSRSFSISSFASDEVDYSDLLSLHGDSSAETSGSMSQLASSLSDDMKMLRTEHVQSSALHTDLVCTNVFDMHTP
jgi:hypothetical protein